MPQSDVAAKPPGDDSRPSLADEKVEISRAQEILLIVTLSTTQAVQEACLGIVIAGLRPIAESFGVEGDSAQQSWFAASYALTVGTFVLPFGRIGDLYGHRTLVLIGWLWFSVWSIVTGLSVYSGQVIFFDFCRGMQGIGPAMLIPNAIAILGRQYPEESLKKNIVFGLFGTLAPAGFVGGCLLGALFGQLTSNWSWAFYTIGLMCMVLGVLSAYALPKSTMVRPTDHMLARLDAVGGLIAVPGLVLFNFAWNQAYVVGWAAAYNGITLAFGVVLLSAFVWWEGRAEYPLIPTKYFDTEATLTLVVIVCGFMSFGIWDFYYFVFSTQLRGYTPLAVTAQFTPILISGTIAALVAGYALHRTSASFVLSYAMLAFVVATLLLAIAPVEQTYWAITFVSMLIEPWGIDAAFPACTIILANRFPQEHQGAAASIVNTLVNYSISLGLGMAGTVERNVSSGDNPTEVLKGFRGAFWLGTGLAGLALAIALSFLLHDFITARKHKRLEVPISEEEIKA